MAKIKVTNVLVLLASTLLGASTVSHAADSGAYLGAGVGETSNNSQTSYKVFGGYLFNRNVGIEAEYFDSHGNTHVLFGNASYSTSNSGVIVAAVGLLPIG